MVELSVHTSPRPGKEELIDCDRIHQPLTDVAERGRRGENVITCEWFGD